MSTSKSKNSYIIIFILIIGCLCYFVDLSSGKECYRKGLAYYEAADEECYFDEDGLEKAISYLEKALKRGVKERELYDKLAFGYSRLNEDEYNSERIYSLALQQYPKDIEFYFRRGQCRQGLKEYKKAYEDFNKAILIDTSKKYIYYSSLYYERGAMRFMTGDTLNAKKDLETAEKLDGHELRDYKDYCRKFE